MTAEEYDCKLCVEQFREEPNRVSHPDKPCGACEDLWVERTTKAVVASAERYRTGGRAEAWTILHSIQDMDLAANRDA